MVIGHPFNAPKLINPNNLTIIYSSSNEKAATVDAQGNVTITGVGEAVIKAQIEEIPSPAVRTKAAEYLKELHDGMRDFRF